MSSSWPVLAAALVLASSMPTSADSLSTPSVFYQDVSWSPDGTKIAFSAMINQQPSDIYSMVLRGKVISKLTDNEAPDTWTSWSKDGAQIYFTSKRDGNDEIYVMKSDGGAEKRLTNNTARDAYPSLSPDGTEMVLVSDRDGSTDLYIMSIDGSKTERLTSTAAREYNPQWSPSGDQIACYVSTDGEKDQVLIIDAASGDSRVLGGAATKNTFPAWSADGQSVIYCSSPSESEKWIFQATLDGSKDEKLLPLTAFYAKYSPDGNRVAYIGGGWPSSNIYVIDYSDGTLRCLTCDMPLTPQPEQTLANKKSKPGK